MLEATRNAIDWVRPGTGRGGDESSQRFRVRNCSDYPDSLVCRAWNFKTKVEGTSEIHVAKPWDIRRSTSHGKIMPDGVAYDFTNLGNLTRRATKGSVSETQIVTPPYLVDTIEGPDSLCTVIRAVRGIGGGTGVLVDGKAVEWEEVSARAFAAQSSGTLIADATVAGITVGNSQNNFGAHRDPGPDDGVAYGWGVGSQWVNVLTGSWFVCVDPAIGAADWRELGAGGGVTDAEYEVATPHAGLSAERATTDVPRGGIKTDFSVPGQVKRTATSVPVIVNATSGGTVTGKSYVDGTLTSPQNKVLAGFTSDNDAVTITVEVDAGPIGNVGSGWQPTVTVYGGTAPIVVTNLAPIVAGTRRFTGTATINATANGTIYATTDDGGRSQDVTYTRALDPPLILTAIFAAQASGIYPGVQTQFKAGDTMRITGTTQTHAARVFLKNAGISDSLQGPFTVTAGAFDFTATVGTRASATQIGTLYADTGSGTTAGADFNTTNTADQDQTSPTFTYGAITYPGAQEALKDSEWGAVSITHTNIVGGETYAYDNNGTGEIGYSTQNYVANKPVQRIGGNYRETGTNHRLTVTRLTKNGKSATATATVKIAHTTPVITITDSANAVLGRMGSDNGALGYRDWTVKIRSSQANLSTYTGSVSLTLGAADTSSWQGSWAASGSQDYTRALRIEDGDLKAGGQAANNYTWGACSVKNRAGKEAIVVTTNTTYALGGFQPRTLTQPAAPIHQIAIGCRVVDTAKLVAVNSSKGGSPTQEFEASIQHHNDPNPALNDYFTISDGADGYDADGSTYHNSDKLFSDSNTSGTAKIDLRENP